MPRCLGLLLALAIALAGCTGKAEDDAPAPAPLPDDEPEPVAPARTTPSPTSSTAPPSPTTPTPSSAPTPTPTPPTPSPPPPSTKTSDFSFALVVGGANAPEQVPLPAGEGGNCGSLSPVTILSATAEARWEAANQLVGEIELVALGPDGTALARVAGASPLGLVVPAVAKAEQGVTFVVQFAEEPVVPVVSQEVAVAVRLVLPSAEAAPTQNAATTCGRVA